MIGDRSRAGSRIARLLVETFTLVAVVLGCDEATAALADFRIIHAFSPLEGGYLNNVIQASDGNAYGTALGSNDNLAGLVFKIGQDGNATVLYRFSGSLDGGGPTGLTEGPDGWLYGMTQNGGSMGLGTVFKISKAGEFEVLHDFKSQSVDGGKPQATLVLGSDGNFYGAAFTVFRLALDGTLAVLNPMSQWDAQSIVQAPDGWLYGTGLIGGQGPTCYEENGCGSVFKMSTDGWTAWTHPMSDYDYWPSGLVWGPDGNLYGVANDQDGCHGAGCGVIFRASPDGRVQVVFKFDGVDGESPGSLVSGADGRLYGATFYGGHSYQCWRCGGTVFRLNPDGTLTTLHLFRDWVGGSSPDSLFFGNDGALYGVSYLGGMLGEGTFFRLHLPRH